jgi:tetratricopeptide (TPR) repeat protein
MAMVYGNFGVIYNSLKNNNASLAYHQKALQLYEEIQDDYSISLELGNIGHAYHALGNDSAALRCLNRSLEIAEKIKVNLLISQTKYEIANVFFQKR